MTNRLLIIVVIFLACVSTKALWASSPYRMVDREWPAGMGKDVYCLSRDVSADKTLFIEAQQLTNAGQPVTVLEKRMSLWTFRKMMRAIWKEEVDTALSYVTAWWKCPQNTYQRLLDLIEEHSPDEAARLRNLRTLAAIFEARRPADLAAQWQGFSVTAYTVVGRIKTVVLLNETNGHVVQFVSFPEE